MDAERWEKIETIYHAALARPAGERDAYLGEACRSDEGLRAEVEVLIGRHEQSGSFIDTPIVDLGVRVLAAQAGLSAGKTVGHYVILDIIGRGGMGEVYLARDPRLGRKVALKLLPVELKSDKDRVHRFRQEARAASAVSHPNIAHVYDVGEVEGRFYTAIEYVDGVSLRQLIVEGKIDTARALDITIQVGEALAAAHAAGIVHRDIKPENVMVRHDGYVKVLDFGLAKLIEQSRPSTSAEAATLNMVQTESGVLMGTASYMSPEQARGQEVDARTDIWSLGVVLYEMVAGTAPFVGESMSDVIAAILKSEPSPITPANNESEELNRIVRKAFRKDRAERYQTVNDLSSDLKILRRTLESHAGLGDTSPSQDLNRTQTVEYRPTSSAEFLITEIKEHKRSVLLALSLIVICFAGLGYAAYRLAFSTSRRTITNSMQIKKLTADGKIATAAISPDGNYLGYVLEKGNERSLWIKHLATDSTLQIVGPSQSPDLISFSKDGGYIYYTDANSDYSLFRVPVLGGTCVRVLDNMWGDFSFSPDGRQITFKRFSPRFDSYDVMIANVDGKDERKLTTRKPPLGLNYAAQSGPAWSSDGNKIVYAGEVPAGIKLFELSLPTGHERELGQQIWSNVWRVNWVSDGTALIIAGQRESSLTSQMWELSYPGAELKRLTNDDNHYIDASLSADSKTLVAIHQDTTSQIWTMSPGQSETLQQLTFGNEGQVAWTADDRILYVARVSDGTHLWIMDKNGVNKKKLTSQPGILEAPSISPDGHYVAYAFETQGRRSIWRMNIDGSNPIQLTHGDSDEWPTFSPDGQSVLYNNSTAWVVSKVPVDGGEPSKIIDKGLMPRVSPDGKFIVSQYSDSKSSGIQVTPVNKQDAIKTFNIPLTVVPCLWLRDGSGVSYNMIKDRVANIWVQPLDGSPPRPITDLRTDYIQSFDWSRDGKRLAIARARSTTEADLITEFR